MVAKGYSSMKLICSILLIIMVLYATTPQALGARKLEEYGTTNASNSTEHGDQSKSGVHGSEYRRDGSATGDSYPNGTVNLPPPTAMSRVTYQDGNGYGNTPATYPDTQQQGNPAYTPPDGDYSNTPSGYPYGTDTPPAGGYSYTPGYGQGGYPGFNTPSYANYP
ncbi:hypothetical protein Tsubulata_014376 [Turnera subulata]|uniref:Uncharacterized protein n=1 Tax=Turnera subulata TaxID=218843 RepID=A0A9Q0GFR1_9ROSI|nr:hypothetical protein Tsubulata_014376 [Turnera subulata]